MTSAATLTPGFKDPSLDAQATFRLVLDAMARPGRIKSLDDDAPTAPPGLDDAAFAIALTLFDFETPVWLDQRLAVPDVVESLRFHCGSPIVEQPLDAAFALISDPLSMPSLPSFSRGTPDYPDRAATLIIQVEGLAMDEGWTLTGPGIDGEAGLRILGLPEDMVGRLQSNSDGFPNGLDFIFTHGRQFVCLPRTTTLEG
jgi:alpha-D-ribose 1-methylphosphonate 5-triphosphate synthase subunit PhnH